MHRRPILVFSVLPLAIIAFIAIAAPRAALASQPEIIFQFPKDGMVLQQPPKVLQMCFKQPVNVKDLDKGGDFSFRLLRPDRFGLGMRIVFQPDGYGVAIYPGLPEEAIPEGEWTWDYRVTDPEAKEALEGTVKFSVNSQTGQGILEPTPPGCSSGQGPVASGSTTSPGPRASEVITGTGRGQPEEDDGGPDALVLSLLAIGAVGGAGVLGLIGYLVRRRGLWPRRPSSGDGGQPPQRR